MHSGASSRPALGSRLPSMLSLLVLIGGFLGACVAWAGTLLLWFHPAHLDWHHLEALPRSIQDAYTVGMYLLLPFAIAWYWKVWEGRQWSEVGLRWNGRELVFGAVLGIAGLVFIYGLSMALGWVHPRWPQVWPWRALAMDCFAGLAMGLAEELLFRGIVLRTLLRDLRPMWALPFSALLFALPHAIHPGQALTWSLLPFLGGLFATGWLFAYAAWSRGSLWVSTGIHAVWIAFISLVSQYNMWAYAPQGVIWTGSGYPTSGLLALFVMGASFLMLRKTRKC